MEQEKPVKRKVTLGSKKYPTLYLPKKWFKIGERVTLTKTMEGVLIKIVGD